MFTNESELTNAVMTIVEALVPDSAIAQGFAAGHAISADGYIYPEALRLLGAVVQSGAKNDTTRNTSSTSAWTTHCVATIPVGAGTWSLRATGDVRCNHSNGNTVDTRLLLNGQVIDTSSESAPSGSPAPFSLFGLVGGLPGNAQHTIELQFKSGSSGTTTAGIARVVVDALRMT